MTAAGYTDNSFVFDIKVQRLFAAHPNDDRQVKSGGRTPIKKLADLSGLQLNQLPLVRDAVAGPRGDEFRAPD
jgi:hypothetical protein